MARTLALLDAAQHREFDRPPPFQPTQRRLFFTLPDWATQVLATLVAPHSRGGFVLQVGNFKAAGRFFLPDRFPVADQAVTRGHPKRRRPPRGEAPDGQAARLTGSAAPAG